MGLFTTYTILKTVSFEEIQQFIHRKENDGFLLNTLGEGEQRVLIKGSLPISREEEVINGWIERYEYQHPIYVYGRNHRDDTTEKRVRQLNALGFSNVFLYRGGLFEWVLLQDVYGPTHFPTTGKVEDILLYK